MTTATPERTPTAMCRRAILHAATCAVLIASAGGLRPAAALCSAAEVIATVAGCPNSSAPCVINQPISIDSGSCVLDFGDRDVSLIRRMTVGSNAVTVRARSFEISRAGAGFSGDIFAQGSGGTFPGSIGGTVVIETTGEMRTLGSGTTFLLAGNGRGGFLRIDAGGSVTLNNNINASNLNNSAVAGGGTVDIRSDNHITTAASATIDASGGNNGPGGGEVNIVARGNISVLGTINVNGFDGGTVSIAAGNALTVRAIQAIGNGDAGSGGCLSLESGSSTSLEGAVVARGTAGTFQTGGCGGVICLDSKHGDIRITPSGSITATGATPDGGGGLVAIFSGRSFEGFGAIDIRGPNGPSCGGEFCVSAELDITTSISGPIIARGGDGGGGIDLGAGRHVRIFGTLDAQASRQGGSGGLITVESGLRGSGDGEVVISGLVDATARNGCSIENGCGDGGTVDVTGADVTVAQGGQLTASGAFAGDNAITARRAIAVRGSVLAVGAQPDGAGLNDIFRTEGQPLVITGTINPAASFTVRAACTGGAGDSFDCLLPSPPCGDGIVQFPEPCDPGPAASQEVCGSCSLLCEPLASAGCSDGLVCTTDSCSPLIGCVNLPIPGSCTEPTVTNTPTTIPTATTTHTRTATATPSLSPTTTQTATVTQSHSPSTTPSVSPTPSITPTATPTEPATSTPTITPTPSATPTGDPTELATTTPPHSPTPPPPTHSPEETATQTETPAEGPCPGDCNGDGVVTVNELITAVNISLGLRSIDACTAADLNGNGLVAINELVSAVLSALDGC